MNLIRNHNIIKALRVDDFQHSNSYQIFENSPLLVYRGEFLLVIISRKVHSVDAVYYSLQSLLVDAHCSVGIMINFSC